MHGVPDGRLTRVELGRSRPLGETPAQHYPRSMRRARRLPAPVLGALTAVLIVAASWPAAASASIHAMGPGSNPASPSAASPSPAPTAQPWLLGRAAPNLVAPSVTLAPA